MVKHLFIKALCVVSIIAFPLASSARNDSANVSMDIQMNNESEAVGLKRLEVIEKLLSPDLVNQKRKLIKSIESDYETKIVKLMESLISPVVVPKVIANLNVNFFSEGFDSEVKSSNNLSVVIMIDRSMFSSWQDSHGGKEQATSLIQGIVSNTFGIPQENITIVLIR